MRGALPQGVIVSAVISEALTVTVDGRVARLAIVDEDGRVICSGDDVADEVQGVAVECYRRYLRQEGHLRVLSKPKGAP